MPIDKKKSLRFITCGSVDDGKSSLIGRMLFESGSIYDDQLVTLKKESAQFGTRGDKLDFALLVDGLLAEREQGITIDVAYRYFSTDQRSYIAIDTPGHEQYTRNMATGASNASLAIILVDARKGILTQTKRHTRISSMMGIKHILLAVNKMDLVNFSESIFQEVSKIYRDFAAEFTFSSLQIIPVCSTEGDNFSKLSKEMPWYQGPSLLSYLDEIDVDSSEEFKTPFSMPVQLVNRPHLDFRAYCGNIITGNIKSGDTIQALPSRKQTTVKAIIQDFGEVNSASAGNAISITLNDEIDISAGDIICATDSSIEIAGQFECQLIWMSDSELIPGRQYILKIHSKEIKATISKIKYEIDVNTGQHNVANTLKINAIGTVNITTNSNIAFTSYQSNRNLGGFILIDPISFDTVGAGMISHALRRSQNIQWQNLVVSANSRASIKNQKACCIWMTGLSGSGKSTIANLLEKKLHSLGKHTYILDGDNIRHGLNQDLGFTEVDRVENIRRTSEVAALMVDAGLIVIASFISPFRRDRELARNTIGDAFFYELFVDTPLNVCESRDPKGLYQKARIGSLRNFTGIDSPYEPPVNANLVIDTTNISATETVASIIKFLRDHGHLC
jgi:bifunctional enzyme CysN/CysC